jgi:catechol 2,3-dioxygenase-like lactoylglutathione lyase family enzyme
MSHGKKIFGEIMIASMNHITLGVTDINKSFAFYRDVLGLKPIVKWDKGVYFFVGEPNTKLLGSGFWFCLNVDEKRIPNPCYTHYAFSVLEKNFDNMLNKIIASGCKIFKENTSPGKSLYFLDPDGHKLEIHVGTPEMRIAVKKSNAGHWKNVEWFV